MKCTQLSRRSMKTEKIRSYVGFSVKAGKAKIGIDNILSAKKEPFVVLYDEKLSDNSKKKLLSSCKKSAVFSAPMSEILPGKNCLAIGVCEKNLASAIIKEMEENS